MAHINGTNGGVTSSLGWSESTRDVARRQLDNILNSPHFRSSRRCSIFLRYVVEHAISNSMESLKERTIGVEVFERSPHYDTNHDPVVRVAAGEVRKRLAQYYTDPGHENEPRISLPAGSYVPDLQPAPYPEPAPAVAAAPESDPPTRIPDEAPGRKRRARVYAVAALICAAAVAAGWTLLHLRGQPTALDAFWEPVFRPDGPVLVCLGQPKAYQFLSQTQAQLDRWFDSNPAGRQPPEALLTVPLTEFVPSFDSYISVHDAEVFARLSALFSHHGKLATIRGGRSVSLADLRGRPVVLVGAFNNEWTLSLAGELRFYFEVVPGKGEIVRDRRNPENLEWTSGRSWPYRRIPLDYALVTRVRNPLTEQVVVIAAGITHYGTQAAGEFITNPSYFAAALKNAPADWERKNLQVVLSAKVMSGTIGPPKVLAVHYW